MLQDCEVVALTTIKFDWDYITNVFNKFVYMLFV